MEEGSHQKAEVETTDRGCFDFFKKKEDGKCVQEDASMEESNLKGKEEHHSESGSSSGSDEEIVGEKKRKKKGLKDKIMGKIAGEKKGDRNGCKGVSIPDQPEESTNYNGVANADADAPSPEAKRGFLEKFKDKLPGQHKKAEEDQEEAAAPAACKASGNCVENEHNEKKGILEKIKDKIPGSKHRAEEEKKKD